MILTDYFKASKLTEAKTRFDIVLYTPGYDHFENLLVNKRGYNVGGLSFNLVSRPAKWQGRKTDLAITKGSSNISSVKRPNINSNICHGNIQGTNDACIILYNLDFKDNGIHTIEIFIARGQRYDEKGLYELFTDGELNFEIELLRDKAIDVLL